MFEKNMYELKSIPLVAESEGRVLYSHLSPPTSINPAAHMSLWEK